MSASRIWTTPQRPGRGRCMALAMTQLRRANPALRPRYRHRAADTTPMGAIHDQPLPEAAEQIVMVAVLANRAEHFRLRGSNSHN